MPITSIFDTLQQNLGTAYVNDFNAFGRVYQVRAQADQRFRSDADGHRRLRVRSSNGALVPLGTLVEVQDVSGPDLIQRYNMYTSVPLQGNAGPGVSSGAALDEMEALARADTARRGRARNGPSSPSRSGRPATRRSSSSPCRCSSSSWCSPRSMRAGRCRSPSS